MKGLRTNCSLIHLDVGSNDVTYEGAQELFRVLERNPTLTSLTLANHDRLHRNRMGNKACTDLKNLLIKNKILSMLNISDNGLANEGLKMMQPALNKDCGLVALNLANNDLVGQQAVDYLIDFIRNSRVLKELNLS